LKARVKIATYYDHPDLLLPLTLVSKPTTVYRGSAEPSPLSNQPLVEPRAPGQDEFRCASVLTSRSVVEALIVNRFQIRRCDCSFVLAVPMQTLVGKPSS